MLYLCHTRNCDKAVYPAIKSGTKKAVYPAIKSGTKKAVYPAIKSGTKKATRTYAIKFLVFLC